MDAGNLAEAQTWHRKLFPLCRDMLGLATNPIPIKAAMKMLGRDPGELRLPMTPLEDAGMTQAPEDAGGLRAACRCREPSGDLTLNVRLGSPDLRTMPRLLILCEYPTLLGGERSMLATLPAVAAAGFDVSVAAPPDGPLADALRERGIAHVAWQTHDAAGERLPLDRLRADLADVLQQTQPDLLHANSLSTARIAGPVAVECGVRSIGHLRDIVKLSRQAIDDLNRITRLRGRLAGDARLSRRARTRCREVRRRPQRRRSGRISAAAADRLFAPRARPAGRRAAHRRDRPARPAQRDRRRARGRAADCRASCRTSIGSIVGERTSNKDESREFEALLRSIAAEPPLAGRVHFLGQPQRCCPTACANARSWFTPPGRSRWAACCWKRPLAAWRSSRPTSAAPAKSSQPRPDAACLVRPDSHLNLADAILSLLTRRRSPPSARRSRPPARRIRLRHSHRGRPARRAISRAAQVGALSETRLRVSRLASIVAPVLFGRAIVISHSSPQSWLVAASSTNRCGLRFIRRDRKHRRPPRRLANAGDAEFANRRNQLGDLRTRERPALRGRKALARQSAKSIHGLAERRTIGRLHGRQHFAHS